MEPIPFRIRLGVTGHRILENEKILKEKIDQVLQTELLFIFDAQSRKNIENSTSTEIVYSLLTPLAEGADRLVAESVLEYSITSSIEVVLPLTLSDYKETFRQTDDPRFDKLYGKAKRKTNLRKHDLRNDQGIILGDKNVTIETKMEESRKDAYEKVGRYVVNRCDVLIALWDGKASRGRGGTQEIIEYAEMKNRPIIIISTNAPYNLEIRKGFGLNGDAFEQIDRFNNYSISEVDNLKYMVNLHKMFFPPEETNCLNDESKKQEITNIFPYYIKSSIMAKRSKKIYKPTGNLIYICSALAIISVLFGLLYPPAVLSAFVVEFICLIAILLVYFFAERFHQKWLESRFLTERFRAACYFILCGFKVNSIDVPPHMGIAHKSNDWMVQVFNEVWDKLPNLSKVSKEELGCYKNYIVKHWFEDQSKYHEGKAVALQKTNKRFEAFGWIIFSMALLASGIHIMHELLGGPESHSIIESILLFMAIALPAIGAAVIAIRKHGEFERLETRSQHMSIAIQDLKVDIDLANNVDEFEKRMNEFDELMLRENQDWLMLMKLVKLEVYP